MHILLIHQFLATPNEAGGTRQFELAQHLIRKGHKITFICSTITYLTGKPSSRQKGKFLVRETIDGINIIRTYTFPGLQESFKRRIISFLTFMMSSIIGGLSVGKTDVVIASSPQIFVGISGHLLSKIKRVPFLLEIRDLWPKFAIDIGVLKSQLIIKLSVSLEKYIYKKADYFIINSPGFYDHLEKSGIERKKIFLVPNGVDTKIFSPSDKHNWVRKELGLNEDFVVLYSGAHGLANSLKTVIESARLLQCQSDIKIIFVGDGKEKRNLIQLRDKYKLNNVIFVDAQPKRKMPDYCNAADVCLAILKKLDSFKTTYPNKLFDYMACGRPTILAIDGVAREVLEKARAGEFVEPENPQQLASTILKFYNNRDLIKEYGINARSYVEEHFDREKIAEKFNNILNEITK